jgi:hypothetical protein
MAAWYFTRNRIVRNSTFIRSAFTFEPFSAGTRCCIVDPLRWMRRTEITDAVQEDSELETEFRSFWNKRVRQQRNLSQRRPAGRRFEKRSRFGASSVVAGTRLETASPLVPKCRPSGHLEAFSGCLWPTCVSNTYARFFKSNLNSIVAALEVNGPQY